jgi:hypothetical protein
MTRRDYIPAAEKVFVDWVKALVEFISTKISEWSIPQYEFDLLQVAKDFFISTYEVAIDPATRTKTAIAAKNRRKKELIALLRSFIKTYIAFNPAVTEEERIGAGLPIPKSDRTPAPVPTRYPNYTVESSLRQLTVHFFDVDSKHTAKPDGVHGAEIRWAILEEPPVNENALTQSSFDTRTPFVLTFTEDQRGKAVYMCLRWENTRGQKGPWGNIMKEIVP